MFEKVKVSQALANAIEFNLGRISKDDFLKDQSKAGSWESDINLPLNDISLYKLAEILINGYEVEQTPEEQFINWYKGFCPAIPGDAICLEVIHKMIDILGIKIKGINE